MGKKKMSVKVKQRIQHRKEKQLAAKNRQLLPEIGDGGTENNDAISLAPTSLLGKKRKLNRLIRIVKKRRKHLREEAKQRKSESAQDVMEGQNEDHDVEQSDWRWDEVYETWMYEPLQEKTRLKRKKNLTKKNEQIIAHDRYSFSIVIYDDLFVSNIFFYSMTIYHLTIAQFHFCD